MRITTIGYYQEILVEWNRIEMIELNLPNFGWINIDEMDETLFR
jgi:hypothetical protein